MGVPAEIRRPMSNTTIQSMVPTLGRSYSSAPRVPSRNQMG